jgi:hypothetical protein
MYNRGEISTMMTLQHEEGVKRQTEKGDEILNTVYSVSDYILLILLLSRFFSRSGCSSTRGSEIVLLKNAFRGDGHILLHRL